MWDEATVVDCPTWHNSSWLQIPSPCLSELLWQKNQSFGRHLNIQMICWATAPRPELGGRGLQYRQSPSLHLCESCGLKSSLGYQPQTISVPTSPWDNLEAETRDLGHSPLHEICHHGLHCTERINSQTNMDLCPLTKGVSLGCLNSDAHTGGCQDGINCNDLHCQV